MKKLHLEAKLSNLRMALVPFKNLLRFLQKKCSKQLKIEQKNMSRVAKFVSHNNMSLNGMSQSYFGTHNSNFWPLKGMYGGQLGQK